MSTIAKAPPKTALEAKRFFAFCRDKTRDEIPREHLDDDPVDKHGHGVKCARLMAYGTLAQACDLVAYMRGEKTSPEHVMMQGDLHRSYVDGSSFETALCTCMLAVVDQVGVLWGNDNAIVRELRAWLPDAFRDIRRSHSVQWIPHTLEPDEPPSVVVTTSPSRKPLRS